MPRLKKLGLQDTRSRKPRLHGGGNGAASERLATARGAVRSPAPAGMRVGHRRQPPRLPSAAPLDERWNCGVHFLLPSLKLGLMKKIFLNPSFPPQVKGFFSSLKDNGSQLRCVQQTLETIEENIRWMDKNFDKIRVWLQREKPELQ